jgi:adenylate cyclase
VAIHELLAMAPAPEPLARFVEAFGWGYSAWQAQRWEEAITHFTEAQRLGGGDECARLYVERCRRMQQDPPGAAWDGVTVLESK